MRLCLVPAFTKPQSTISVGGAATSGVGADKIIDKSLETQDQSSIPGTVNEYGFEKTSGLNNLAVQFLKKSGTKVQDLKKIPGGITKNEVKNFLHLLDSNQNSTVKKIFKDCIEIDWIM